MSGNCSFAISMQNVCGVHGTHIGGPNSWYMLRVIILRKQWKRTRCHTNSICKLTLTFLIFGAESDEAGDHSGPVCRVLDAQLLDVRLREHQQILCDTIIKHYKYPGIHSPVRDRHGFFFSFLKQIAVSFEFRIKKYQGLLGGGAHLALASSWRGVSISKDFGDDIVLLKGTRSVASRRTYFKKCSNWTLWGVI